MTKQRLDEPDVNAELEKVGCEAVPDLREIYALVDASLSCGQAELRLTVV